MATFLAGDEAALAQALFEGGDEVLRLSRRPAAQVSDLRHRPPLRACGERPCDRRAAERGYELPSSSAVCHSPRLQCGENTTP